jgi:membrane protein implicated in regulation of membrane protease activity
MTDKDAIAPVPPETATEETQKTQQKFRVWLVILVVVLLILLLGIAIFFLFRANPAVTTQIRDIFIIVLSLEFMILGAALVILIIQLAKLINLLQNEVKPILDATTETVNTLKGTTSFLSENLVEPVIKLNGYMAGLKKALDLMNIFRK